MFKIVEREKGSESRVINNVYQDIYDPYANIKIKDMVVTMPKRILVVDDDPTIRDVLCRILNLLGFEVKSFGNAFDALNSFINEVFELVLTDIQMPGMNGWELAFNIKKESPDTPVILITGMAKDDVEEKMKNSRADSILFKPFNVTQIKTAVYSFLADQR
jgi:DNA-binding NtrC family response regulator